MRPYENVSLQTIYVIFAILMMWNAVSVSAQTAPSAPQSVSTKNDSLTRSGFEHYYDADYDRAAKDFEKVLALHPDDPAAVDVRLGVKTGVGDAKIRSSHHRQRRF